MTVGHGAVLNMNIPPDRTGKMNHSVAETMSQVGKAINDTFKFNHQGMSKGASGGCGVGVTSVKVEGEFDYVMTMEDLSYGQLIANYSIVTSLTQTPRAIDCEALQHAC